MTLFMDKDNILGEWLAFFEFPSLCKQKPENPCSIGRSEMQSLSLMRDYNIRIAKINW
jgi:hypothetical protein